MMRVHAKVDKVVIRGAKAIASMTAASRECAEELVAKGARAVLEAIAVDPDTSAKAQAAVWDALVKLS